METPQHQTLNTLPKDIIFDIFSRIELKQLYQIQSVSKFFQFLLKSNPEFINFHHQIHKKTPLLLLSQQENSSTQLISYYLNNTQMQIHHFSATNPKPFTKILTCNGILCFISNPNIIICDPIIQRLTKLPNSPSITFNSIFSFGFSPKNEFKVLHFYTFEKFDNFHYCQVKEVICEVISLSNSRLGLKDCNEGWRVIGKCPFEILSRKSYAYVDGKIYWLIYEKMFNPNCVKIMCFDLGSEKFGNVFFSRSYSNRSIECLDLVEIRGKLCLVDRLPWESTMSVWMMVDEGNGVGDLWVKKYEIDFAGLGLANMNHESRIMGCLGGGYGSEGQVLVKFGFGEDRFGLYDLESGVFKELGDGVELQGWNLELVIDRKFML